MLSTNCVSVKAGEKETEKTTPEEWFFHLRFFAFGVVQNSRTMTGSFAAARSYLLSSCLFPTNSNTAESRKWIAKIKPAAAGFGGVPCKVKE